MSGGIRLAYDAGVDSAMARVDPRVKLVWILWVFATIIVFSDPRYQSLAIATVIVGALASRLPVLDIVRAGRIGVIVGIVSWLLWIVFFGDAGDTLFALGPLTVTDAGVIAGLSAMIRIEVVLFSFLITAMTTPTRDIIVALEGLKVPTVFSIVVGLVLRLIPQLQAEHATIVQAQRSRGTEFDKGGLLTRFRKHSSYVIPLSLRALKIVADLSIALEARAFDPYVKRVPVRQLSLRRSDRMLLGLMVVVLLAAIAVRISGHGGLAIPGMGGLGQ